MKDTVISDSITYRHFELEDMPELLRIQAANLRANLSPGEQKEGFLSVGFSARQFEDMNREIPIVVADLGTCLGGFLCASTLAYSRRVPLLAHMMGLFEETFHKERSLDRYRSFFYGPVCIERDLRGRGLLPGMFTRLLEQVMGRYDLGVLFISRNNPRSLGAHSRHLGMRNLRKFEFNNDELFLLVFDVPAEPPEGQ